MTDATHEEGGAAVGEPLASLLGTALAMERRLVEMLPELLAETEDSTLRKELEHHLEESREHVQNIEDVFRAFGKEPEAGADPLLEGLEAAHRSSIEQTDDRDLTVIATAAAAEHTEIARYEVLRALVEARGNAHAVQLIVRTLDQERQALKLVCESMHRILAHTGVEGDLVESGQNAGG